MSTMDGIKKASLLILTFVLVGCSDDATKRAALAGDPKAQHEYAVRIENSDPVEAHRLILLSAAKGNTNAQFHLGKKLLADKTRRDSQEKGFYWVQKAAKAGNLAAQQYLPVCHLRGLGTRVDLKQAVVELRLPLGEIDLTTCIELSRAPDLSKNTELRTALLERGLQLGSQDCGVLLAKQLSAGPDAGKESGRIRELLENAAAARHPEGMAVLGYRLLNGVGMPPKPNKGIEYLTQAAEAGNHDAACELFWPLMLGRFTKKNEPKAYELVRKAQESHHPRAFGLVARCHMFGMGTTKDEHKAVDALRRGATYEDPECLEWLGNIFLKGDAGQQRSLAEAIYHLQRATKAGAIDAYQKLHDAYRESGDNPSAISTLKQGAEAGDIDCRLLLGMAYGLGNLGETADPAKALPHYLIAAEAGNSFGKYLAGELLLRGEQVEKDIPRAVKFLKSASAGNIYGAQFIMAHLYDKGLGVPQDAGQAYFWANLAASLNTDDKDYAKLRDQLAERLNATELTKVQGQCRTWLSRKSSEASKEDTASDSKGGSGSGIIFTTDGLVLTNHHVTAAGSSYTVITSDGQEIPATLVAQDADLDVAVLRLRTRFTSKQFKNPPPLISSAKSRSGEKVFTVGHPLAGLLSSEAKYNEGTISALSGMKDDVHLMQISVPIQPGNSGGPLANTKGEVVGLIVSTINGSALLRQNDIMAQNINFAIKADPIQEFLRANSIAIPTYPAPSDPVEHVKTFAVKVVVHP
jgi:TPR repeat protein